MEKNPFRQILSRVVVFLCFLPIAGVNAQSSGEMPRTPEYRPHERGVMEGPLFRGGVDEQMRGIGFGTPPVRESIPSRTAPPREDLFRPKGGEGTLYWDTLRSKWDWESILRDARRVYAIEVLIKEIERKGVGHTRRDPEGYFYDGAYYRDDLPKWRATQDGFLDRLRTLPRPVLQSAVLRVGIEALKPIPTPSGPPGPFLGRPSLPPGGIHHLRDSNNDETKELTPYIMTAEGKWDISIIAKDIIRARAVALALADIRSQGDSTNPDMASEFGQPVFTEDDLPVLEGFQISVEYFLGQVPLDVYAKAWNEANRIEDEKRDKKRLQGVPGFDPRPGGTRTTGQPSPFGEGPSPGPQRPPQSPVVATPGQGGGGGGASSFLRPGQGGTLVGGGGGQQGGGGGGGGYSPWGSSQQGGGGSLTDPGGVRGGGAGTPGASAGSDESGKGPDKGGDTKNPKKDRETTKKGDDKGSSSGSDVKKTDDGKKGSSDSSGSGSVRGVVTIGEVEIVPDVVEESDLPADPETGRGRDGGDDLKGRFAAHRPPGVTNQDADLVGPAFRKTTGPDDKERPVTGGTSGSVSGDPSESRTNDVGGLHDPRPGGGGEGGSAFESLMKRLGLWEKWQAGGPDPAK